LEAEHDCYQIVREHPRSHFIVEDTGLALLAVTVIMIDEEIDHHRRRFFGTRPGPLLPPSSGPRVRRARKRGDQIGTAAMCLDRRSR
jgi:hypothetical protein